VSRRSQGPLAVFLFAALTVFGAAPAMAAPLPAAQVAEIDRIVSGALAKSGAPSASIAVVRHGEIALVKADGERSLAPISPATTEARYHSGSVSKQFTAAAVLLLAEQGKLSLDDPVGRYFPSLTSADRVTVRQLLSHTAGYPNYWTVGYVAPYLTQRVAPQAVVDRWGRQPLDFAPGSKWNYTNTGYMIAGRIAETVAGEPLPALLRRLVFAPLAMKSAGDLCDRPLREADARGYTRYVLGPPRPPSLPACGWEFAAGGLAMTARDLAKWDVSVIAQSLMKPASYAAQQLDTRLSDGSASGYGLGVYVDAVRGHRRIQHDGAAMGFLTQNRIYPDDRTAVVVMVNADYGSASHTIAEAIEAMLLPTGAGSPAKEPTALSRNLVGQLREGRLDRSLLTANANAYFTDAVVADYRDSLSKLGEPVGFVREKADVIDGLNASIDVLTWPDHKLILIMRLLPDGRVEELTIFSPD